MGRDECRGPITWAYTDLMNRATFIVLGVVIIIAAVLVLAGKRAPAPESSREPSGKMSAAQAASFFITSANPGKGGDLGGLAGADAYCAQLAEAAGLTGKEWRAYLSTTGAGGVNARERIGTGPWYNVRGEMIAATVEELHTTNNLTKATALTERGETVSGRGDTPNLHDILTGSTADGMASTTATTDTTCDNWTSSTDGSAIVGHHDRVGIDESAPMKSWNSSHGSRGCSPEGLTSTGGGGLFYCFAL